MNKQEFKALTEKGVVLLDGATGSNLRKMGMPVGICTEKWVFDHPEIICQLQSDYAQAGSHIVYAPTFGANRISLKGHGLEDQLVALNQGLVVITRKAVGDQVLVAGDITTTGCVLEPNGNTSYQELYDVYREQVQVLFDSGVDLLVAETMLTIEETLVALDAAQSVCDLPVMCTLTLEADGHLLYGGTAEEAVVSLQEMGASAVGLNCSVGPDQLEAVIAGMKQVAQVPIIAKPNAGHPRMDEWGQAHYSMDSETFARAMKRLVWRGAGIVGGCCGTTPEYIQALARELEISKEK